MNGPTFTPDMRRTRDALRAAFVAGTDMAKKDARWWNRELKPQEEAPRSSALEGVDAAISARVAGKCHRVLGHELSEEEVRARADLSWAATEKERAAWKRFGVLRPTEKECVSKSAVDTYQGPAWRMVDGAKNVRARVAAKGLQDPDLREGVADTLGCVSIRPSHLRATRLSVLKNGKSGTWISKMLVFKQMASAGMRFLAFQVNENPRIRDEFGNCRLQGTV